MTGRAQRLQIGEIEGQFRVRADWFDMIDFEPPSRAAFNALITVPTQSFTAKILPLRTSESGPGVPMIFAAKRKRASNGHLLAAAISQLFMESAMASNDELLPLSEAIQSRTPSRVIYVLERCAALDLALQSYTGGSLDIPEPISNRLSENAPRFGAIAVAMIQKFRGLSADAALNTVWTESVAIAGAYAKVMKTNYVRSGDAISDLILSDLTVCDSLGEYLPE